MLKEMNQETIETGKCDVLGNTKKGHPRIKMEMKLYRDRDIYSTRLTDLFDENQECLQGFQLDTKPETLAMVRLRLPYHQMLTHYQLTEAQSWISRAV